jgi:hypothetical protein
VNVETKEQSKQWMHTYSPYKPRKFKETLYAYQKADGNCFLRKERNADGGIHATRDHNNVRSALQKTLKKLLRVIQNKRYRMLTSNAVFLHDNARPHKAARTGALLEHFNWELFDHCLTLLS